MKQKQKPVSFSLNPLNVSYIEAIVSKEKEVNPRYNRSVYMDDHITELRLKSEKKATAVKELDLTVYPENLNIAAWRDWIDFRKEAKFKKYKTNAQMKKLAKMGDSTEQFLIVQQSIDNEYQGLFALKGNGNGHQNKATYAGANVKESSHERIKRENDLKYRGSSSGHLINKEFGLGLGTDDRDLRGAVAEGERAETQLGLDNQPFVDY